MEINEDILIRYIDGMLTEEEAAEVKNWRSVILDCFCAISCLIFL